MAGDDEGLARWRTSPGEYDPPSRTGGAGSGFRRGKASRYRRCGGDTIVPDGEVTRVTGRRSVATVRTRSAGSPAAPGRRPRDGASPGSAASRRRPTSTPPRRRPCYADDHQSGRDVRGPPAVGAHRAAAGRAQGQRGPDPVRGRRAVDDHIRATGTARLPVVGGHEGAGVVEAVGRHVTRVKSATGSSAPTSRPAASAGPARPGTRTCATRARTPAPVPATARSGSTSATRGPRRLCTLGTFSERYAVVSSGPA